MCHDLRLAFSCCAPSTRPVRRQTEPSSNLYSTRDLRDVPRQRPEAINMMTMTPPSPPYYHQPRDYTNNYSTRADYDRDYNNGGRENTYNHGYGRGSDYDVLKRPTKSTSRT